MKKRLFKKVVVGVVLFVVLSVVVVMNNGRCRSVAAPLGRDVFYQKIKEYVFSGRLFTSTWSNIDEIVWSREIGDGRFLVAVSFTRWKPVTYYAVRSFYFPIPSDSNFISELDKLSRSMSLSYFSSEAIKEKQYLAFGWIVFEDLCSSGSADNKISGGCALKRDSESGEYEWEFPYKHISYLHGLAREGMGVYEKLPKYFRLGQLEVDYTKDPRRISVDDNHRLYEMVNETVVDGIEDLFRDIGLVEW